MGTAPTSPDASRAAARAPDTRTLEVAVGTRDHDDRGRQHPHPVDRLVKVRQQIDPDTYFRCAQSIATRL